MKKPLRTRSSPSPRKYTYLVGLQHDTTTTIQDLVAKIKLIQGAQIITSGDSTIEVRATAAVKATIKKDLSAICVIGKGSTFRPVSVTH